MDVIRKDATITNTDDAFPGTFEVVLSAPTKDRDGETLLPTEWKQPLPEHITFDVDHGMSVAATVGSGRPSLDEKGRLIVDGTYSSLPRAQEVRTLVKEGHINRTSVAFMSEKTTKDGTTSVTRELLNGAFVAIPSNREAVVLDAKAALKAGARNSAADAERIQSVHDHAAALGAACDGAKSFHVERGGVGFKSVAGSLEATQDRVRDAVQDAHPDAGYVSLRATVPDGNGGGYVIYNVQPADGPWTDDLLQQGYTDSGSVVTLIGDARPVDLMEVVRPDPDEAAEPAADPAAAAAEKSAAAAAGDAADDADSMDPFMKAAHQRFFAASILTGRD